MTDELRRPLKRRGLSDKLKALRPSLLQTATGFVALSAGALAIWLVRADVPQQPSATVVADIPPVADSINTGSTKSPGEAADASEPAAADEAPLRDLPPDPKAVAADQLDASRQQQTAMIIAPPLRLVAAPVSSVTEKASVGPLPHIAKNGKTPFDVYSRPVKAAVLNDKRPKVAIILGGMGLNAGLTEDAIRILPGEVTLAFAPYGNNAQNQINRARANGHEVMLHLPMEPFGYPSVDPGPKTLVADGDPKTNIDNLLWHLSRFSGYFGVVNYLGGRFTSDGGALLPVMSELNRRGLVYLDDGSSERSLSTEIGSAAGLRTRKAVIQIDADPSEAAIEASLDDLEKLARKKGLAIGVGTGLSVTINEVERWAEKLQQDGIELVPVSAAYRGVSG